MITSESHSWAVQARGGVIKEKSGIGKQALITLGAVGGTLLGAGPIFGYQRTYGDVPKNIGGGN